MNKLKEFTSLERLNESIVMKNGVIPELVGKTLGGRYVKIKIGADGQQKELKVSINDLVKKMRSLCKDEMRCGTLNDNEKKAGSEICDKVASLKGREVNGETWLQALGTRIARLKHSFSSDKKEKIDWYRHDFIRIVKHDSREVQNLKDLRDLTKHILKADFNAVLEIIERNPELPRFKNENGNTLLHLLAANLPIHYRDAQPEQQEEYRKIMQYILPRGDMFLENQQGDTPLDILADTPVEYSNGVQSLFTENLNIDLADSVQMSSSQASTSVKSDKTGEAKTPQQALIEELDAFAMQSDRPAFSYAGSMLKNLLTWLMRTNNAPRLMNFHIESTGNGVVFKLEFDQAKTISIKPMLDKAEKDLDSEAFKQKVKNGEASNAIKTIFPLIKSILKGGNLKLPKTFQFTLQETPKGAIFINFHKSIQVKNLLPVMLKSIMVRGKKADIDFSIIGKQTVPNKDFNDFLSSIAKNVT